MLLVPARTGVRSAAAWASTVRFDSGSKACTVTCCSSPEDPGRPRTIVTATATVPLEAYGSGTAYEPGGSTYVDDMIASSSARTMQFAQAIRVASLALVAAVSQALRPPTTPMPISAAATTAPISHTPR